MSSFATAWAFIQPILSGIWTAIQFVGAVFAAVILGSVMAGWNMFAAVLGAVWNGIIKPVWDAFAAVMTWLLTRGTGAKLLGSTVLLLLAVALAAVFGTALNGRCAQRPELAQTALPLRIELPAVPCKGGPEIAERIFAIASATEERTLVNTAEDLA